MNIIFLDFDGVLNNAEWISEIQRKNDFLTFFERHEKEFDPTKVKLMSDFAIEIEASIVISSSWRKLHSLQELTEMLQKVGMDTKVPIIGMTSSLNSGFRGEEVQHWVTTNAKPIKYVIFDDDGDFYPYQPLVKTSWDEGLFPSHIELARERLLNQ